MLRDDWYNLHKNDAPEDASKPSFRKKWNNWWYYNKWYVVGALVVLAILIDFGHSIWVNRTNKPDFQIAYLGAMLPQDTTDRLEQALSELAPDANGDGKVIVTVNQYNLYASPEVEDPAPIDPAMNMAAQTKLSVDLQMAESFLFLMPDPEKFQQNTQALSRIDGTFPSDTPDSALPLYLSWKDCPVLAGLDLGMLSESMLDESAQIENQALLENLFVGRRYIDPETDPEYSQACDEFWNALLSGATLN